MKKFSRILSAVIIASAMSLMVARHANAQTGFGIFDETRALQCSALNKVAVNVNLITNQPQDMVPYTGRGEFIINALTNGAGIVASGGVQLFSSPDLTNWTAVVNYALISSNTAIAYTNFYYGFGTNGSGGVLATNSYLLPFNPVSPIPFSALFSTPYPSYNLFTNVGPATLNLSGTTILGVNVTDNGRYFEEVFTNGGNATNGSYEFSCQFIGTPKIQ